MNPTPAFRRLSAILPGLVLVLSLAVSIYDPQGAGSYLRNQVFDLYQRILPREAGPEGPHAVYIDIDAETAKTYGAWPWPRKRLDDLASRVKNAGAEAILIDMPLADRDPTSTAELMRLWAPLQTERNLDGLGSSLTRVPNYDRQLTALLASTPSVVSFVPGKTAFQNAHDPLRRAAITPQGGDPRHYMNAVDTWRATLPAFEAAAKGNGATLPDTAPGKTVRGLPI